MDVVVDEWVCARMRAVLVCVFHRHSRQEIFFPFCPLHRRRTPHRIRGQENVIKFYREPNSLLRIFISRQRDRKSSKKKKKKSQEYKKTTDCAVNGRRWDAAAGKGKNVLRLSSRMYYVKNSPRKNRLEIWLRFPTASCRHGSFDKYSSGL